jgi:hypothetical protein
MLNAEVRYYYPYYSQFYQSFKCVLSKIATAKEKLTINNM